MSDNVVLYCEKLPTEGMETLIAELCPPQLDLRFLYPVKNGKKGDFEDADYILASIHKIGRDEMDRAKKAQTHPCPGHRLQSHRSELRKGTSRPCLQQRR